MLVPAFIKGFAKTIQRSLPFAIGKNELYDRSTKKIIFKHCKPDSICIDIGSNEGKILQWMIESAPDGKHIAFEPIPALYSQLNFKFGSRALIYPFALSDQESTRTFNYVTSNPALSGLLKRPYSKAYQEQHITVKTAMLDQIIDAEQKINLIKIDVEGGEWNVLNGALKTIEKNKPLILFECGKIGGDLYGFTDDNMYHLFNEILNYQLYTLKGWLTASSPLTFTVFAKYYQTGSEYFFLAAPFDFDAKNSELTI